MTLLSLPLYSIWIVAMIVFLGALCAIMLFGASRPHS